MNISCTERFEALPETFKKDEIAGHRFYFEDTEFMRDAYYTILGDTDRNTIPTRERFGDKLILRP